MECGFKIASGVDLSYVFQNGTTKSETNYKLANGSALTFLLLSGSRGNVSNTGYLGSNGQDLSTIFEPRSISIANYNFASPNASASPYYIAMNGTTDGWTFTGSTAVGNGYTSPNPWNRVAIIGQYAILQYTTPYIPIMYQTFALYPMKYKLTFLIIGRNNLYYNAGQSCDVYANTTKILSFSPIVNTAWTTKSIVFTGSYTTIIKFTTDTTVESSYLVTNIVINVA